MFSIRVIFALFLAVLCLPAEVLTRMNLENQAMTVVFADEQRAVEVYEFIFGDFETRSVRPYLDVLEYRLVSDNGVPAIVLVLDNRVVKRLLYLVYSDADHAWVAKFKEQLEWGEESKFSVAADDGLGYYLAEDGARVTIDGQVKTVVDPSDFIRDDMLKGGSRPYRENKADFDPSRYLYPEN